MGSTLNGLLIYQEQAAEGPCRGDPSEQSFRCTEKSCATSSVKADVYHRNAPATSVRINKASQCRRSSSTWALRIWATRGDATRALLLIRGHVVRVIVALESMLQLPYPFFKLVYFSAGRYYGAFKSSWPVLTALCSFGKL